MGSLIIFITVIGKSDLSLMFLFTENYSFGEEHVIAEKIKESIEELTPLAGEVCFHWQCNLLPALNWFEPHDNQRNIISRA